jgi:hypothetical protein
VAHGRRRVVDQPAECTVSTQAPTTNSSQERAGGDVDRPVAERERCAGRRGRIVNSSLWT